MIGEQLKRYNRYHWLQKLGDFGDANHIVCQRRDPRIVMTGNGNNWSTASLDLLDVGHDFVVGRTLGDDEDAWGMSVDQSNRPVLHLGCGIALRVDVADLLQFQRTFESRWEIVLASEVQEVGCRMILLRNIPDLGVACKRLPNRPRQAMELFNDPLPRFLAEVTQASEVQSQHRQYTALRRVGLCASHTNLRSRVKINTPVGRLGDGASHHVTDG